MPFLSAPWIQVGYPPNYSPFSQFKKVKISTLKGQSTKLFDFFFHQRFNLVPKDMPGSDFNFGHIFVELCVLKILKN
jgi:hypothetical protein